MKNNNQIDIPVEFGFQTIPEPRRYPITSENKAYML